MAEASSPRRIVRSRIETGPVLVVPGAANALGARVIEDLGFDAVYVSGAGIANTFFGTPDIGLVTLTEVAAHVAAIRDAVELPLIVDADTGFGNAIGVHHAVQVLERAGADALQLEDQSSPKRCGHFEGKSLIEQSEMVDKIHAAVDARRDEDLVIIARTDARAVDGLDAALERAHAYRAAGADVLFIEAPQDAAEVRALPTLIDAPQVINLVQGGKTPVLPLDELAGFAIALFANLSLQAAIFGMHQVLGALAETGTITPAMAAQVVGFDERQRLVRKPLFDELEVRYGTGAEGARP